VKESKCRSCGAAIVWVPHHETGKLNPLDAEPVEYGGLIVLEQREDGGTVYRILKKGEPGPAGGKRFRSHFSTCVNAQQHRKAKS